MKIPVQVYVLNLKRSPERLKHISESLDRLGLTFIRVEGCDGSLLGRAACEAWSLERPRLDGKQWMPGQIGCFESHFQAWCQISTQRSNLGLVLEDDMHLSGDLRALCSEPSWIPTDGDLVRVEATNHSCRLTRGNAINKKRKLHRVEGPIWGAGAYILRPEVANWLVSSPKRLHLPTDLFLFDKQLSQVARALKVFQIRPGLAIQDKYYFDGDERRGYSSLIDGPEMTPNRANCAKKTLRSGLNAVRGRSLIEFAE